MQEWWKISLILCVFGFLRDIRPSEPFVAEYILGPWRNVTEQQLYQEIYPISTYSYLAQLVLVFLITDFLRYKPLIVVMGISGIIIWSLLLWTTSIEALQVLEFFYGTYMASEIAYCTYMYAKVDKKYYPKVTSHTRSATMIGKLVGSILAQILVYFNVMDYRQLNYITLATQICATFWVFLLPSVDSSLYFHPKQKEIEVEIEMIESAKDEQAEETYGRGTIRKNRAFRLLWSHFCNAYSNKMVLQWSMWYIVALCGYLQVVNYIQVLWKSIDNKPEVVWNGAVDAILTLLGTSLSLAAGYIFTGRNNPRLSLFLLAIVTVVEGLCLLLSSWTSKLYFSYIGYICFGALFSFTATVSSSEVARHLEEESYGLIFGFNTFVALILQTVLTVIVVSKQGLALDIFAQYTVYAFYFVTIGLMYLVGVLLDYTIRGLRASKNVEMST